MDTPQFFPRYSIEIVQFNWWFVAIGAVMVVGAAATLYRNMFSQAVKREKAAHADRKVAFKRQKIRSGAERVLAETIAEAEQSRLAAEAAADQAATAADPVSARRAADVASEAATRSTDAAMAASLTQASLTGGRRPERGKQKRDHRSMTEADGHAAAAREAAERAERAAVAKGG